MMFKNARISRAITNWLPLSAIAAGIAVVSGLLFHLHAIRTLVAAIVTGALVFSAFLLRSYSRKGGQETGQYLEPKSSQ